jgi:hypothetical protein
MIKYAKLRKDGTILVKTPKSYIIDAYKDVDVSPDRMRQIVHELSEDTKFLYDCLKILRMSIAKARKLDLTLNRESGDKLVNMAMENYYVSSEMRRAISNHKW